MITLLINYHYFNLKQLKLNYCCFYLFKAQKGFRSECSGNTIMNEWMKGRNRWDKLVHKPKQFKWSCTRMWHSAARESLLLVCDQIPSIFIFKVISVQACAIFTQFNCLPLLGFNHYILFVDNVGMVNTSLNSFSLIVGN